MQNLDAIGIASADPRAVFAELRQLAAANPREARARFTKLIEEGAPLLDSVLGLAGAPGEGRLRQMIATLARKSSDTSRLASHLLRWRETETDEFAALAIRAALAGMENLPASAATESAELPGVVTTYRYVSERLCHRVRNALADPVRHLRELERLLADGAGDATARARLGQLYDALRDVSRIVDFNLDDAHFEWRAVELGGWLGKMNDAFRRQNTGSVELQIEGALGRGEVRVWAAEYHLNNLFWNLWRNAQQAVEGPCEIKLRSALAAGKIELTVLDNGRGFSPEDAEQAFQGYFLAKGENHGRGLMEVHDAVSRLSGSARMTQDEAGRFRIALSLPLAPA